MRPRPPLAVLSKPQVETPTTSSPVVSKPLCLLHTFQILPAHITPVDLSNSVCIYLQQSQVYFGGRRSRKGRSEMKPKERALGRPWSAKYMGAATFPDLRSLLVLAEISASLTKAMCLLLAPDLPAANPSEHSIIQLLCACSSFQKLGQNKPFCSACEKGQSAPSSAIRSWSCHSTCHQSCSNLN